MSDKCPDSRDQRRDDYTVPLRNWKGCPGLVLKLNKMKDTNEYVYLLLKDHVRLCEMRVEILAYSDHATICKCNGQGRTKEGGSSE